MSVAPIAPAASPRTICPPWPPAAPAALEVLAPSVPTSISAAQGPVAIHCSPALRRPR
eukprot:CAMPEP_0172191016 /NCGR_PEP_ID=MMETSP1050-20130122/23446_1 /TAXON_ID=233186 /ORGANISM="Cryptomonas curvata, Strain CCAP979/52" /LENGTH=57 /DNA_ID=CAMNT_0012865977 /DNA_START=219 /DNA_END=388 /DNA_ORIENTATION=+